MSINRKSSVGLATLLFVMLSLSLSSAFGQDKEKAQINGIQRPLADILNPDGTLRLGSDARGSFNPNGFRMVLGRGGQPRFAPIGSGLLTETDAIVAGAGDENWDSRFGDTAGDPGGLNFAVYAVAVSGTDVYVGGQFASAGDLPIAYIAKWNGTSWSALGEGLSYIEDPWMNGVYAITVNGADVYVGGNFDHAGGILAKHVAKWNTVTNTWSALGSGYNNGVEGRVLSIATAENGTDIYVGGTFTYAGGNSYQGGIVVNNIAKYDALTGTWSNLEQGVGDPYPYQDGGVTTVRAIVPIGSDIYIGGNFRKTFGAWGDQGEYIARWDGTRWFRPAGSFHVDGLVLSMAAIGSDLYVGGGFSNAGGTLTGGLAKWDGTNWTKVEPEGQEWWFSTAWSMKVIGLDLYVGAEIMTPLGELTGHIAKWDGSTWWGLGTGLNGAPFAIAGLGTDVYVGGPFTVAGEKASYYFGHWLGPLTVVSPNGGEMWPAESVHRVTWNTDVGIPNVTLQYSTTPEPYRMWVTIDTIPNTGSYDWTVPDVISDNCYIRIMDATDGSPYDVSDYPFHIIPIPEAITLTSPNGGETWEVGSFHTITWTGGSGRADVNIWYQTGYFPDYPWRGIQGPTPNDGAFDWTIPNTISSTCRVAVTDTEGLNLFDMSDADFTIAGFQVTSPNGGESWVVGTEQTITWNTVGSYPTAKVELSIDNGSTWTIINPGTMNTGSLPWTPTPDLASSQCMIKVSDSTDGFPSDTSEAVFSIIPAIVPAITVTSPNGGENWWGGETYAITWTSSGSVGNVMIEYSTDNGSTWTTIAASTANDGIDNWPVPSTTSTTCLVRVSETDGSPSDVSNEAFSIYVLPTITVTSPNGGENWSSDSSRNITWSWTGTLENVTINYSLDGGANWLYVSPSAPNNGTYAWTIPSTPSTSCLVMVNDALHVEYSDTSDAVFSIVAAASQKDDFVGTWDGQGGYFRNSDTEAWVKMASPATKIAVGDLDGDAIDDLIGLWPGQGGIWVKYSQSGAWAKLSSTAQYICTGDMNGDGRVDLVGTWDGQGVFYRNSITGAWVKMATPATMVTAGDIDNDGTDDLIGLWPSQGGIWVKYSQTGTWAKLSSTAVHIAAGDMNGDGRDDLLGTWDGQGVYYRDSFTGTWVKMASPATLITTGDIDGDAIDDLIGIWPTQGGVWVKYSSDGTWERLSSTAQDIAAGKMRAAAGGGEALPEGVLTAQQELVELPLPMGGIEEGPGVSPNRRDLSDRGPSGARFVFLEDINLEPKEEESARLTRVPGPGEAGAKWVEQTNLFPLETPRKEKEKKADAGVKIRKAS
jgi:hypothetical protein